MYSSLDHRAELLFWVLSLWFVVWALVDGRLFLILIFHNAITCKLPTKNIIIYIIYYIYISIMVYTPEVSAAPTARRAALLPRRRAGGPAARDLLVFGRLRPPRRPTGGRAAAPGGRSERAPPSLP